MDSKQTKNIVIGANSFIGCHLIGFLKKTSQVVGVYHSNTDHLDADVVNIPVSELHSIDPGFDNVYIISAYIPSQSRLNAAEREKMFQANVALAGTVCSRFSKSKIIYCSSVSVYRAAPGIITEDSPEGGLNEYGISKLWGERIVQQMDRYAIVRCSSVYGYRMNLSTIIPGFVKQALNARITVYGDGSRCQNYVHVSDVVGILNAAAQASVNGIFLATAPVSISNKQLAELITGETGGTIAFEQEDRSPSFFYSNERTVQQLGYKPATSIENGIKEIIQWMKKIS